MKKYKLKEGVYLVEGKVNGCIYDLNEKTIYSTNPELQNAIKELVNHQRVIHDEFVPMIQEMIDAKLLEETDTPEPLHDIREVVEVFETFDLVWIEVTKVCNLRCIHCYEDASLLSEGEMAWEDYAQIIDQLKELHVKRIQLIGGEPFVLKRDKLTQMLEYAAQHMKNVEIFTNATFLDEAWVEFLKTHNVMVRVSMHSLDEENYEKVTGNKGAYHKAYRGIQLLREHEVPHTITCVAIKGIDRCNVDKEPDFGHLDTVRMSGRGNLDLVDEKLVRERMITPKRFEYPLDVQRLKRSVVHHQCFGYKLYITTDLTVYPCPMERRLVHGNLKGSTIDAVLTDSIFRMNKDHIEECKDCEYRYFCYDCRPDSLERDLTAKPWYCTYLPLEGRWLDEDEFVANLFAGKR